MGTFRQSSQKGPGHAGTCIKNPLYFGASVTRFAPALKFAVRRPIFKVILAKNNSVRNL
jgi:hypothetical protein